MNRPRQGGEECEQIAHPDRAVSIEIGDAHRRRCRAGPEAFRQTCRGLFEGCTGASRRLAAAGTLRPAPSKIRATRPVRARRALLGPPNRNSSARFGDFHLTGKSYPLAF